MNNVVSLLHLSLPTTVAGAGGGEQTALAPSDEQRHRRRLRGTVVGSSLVNGGRAGRATQAPSEERRRRPQHWYHWRGAARVLGVWGGGLGANGAVWSVCWSERGVNTEAPGAEASAVVADSERGGQVASRSARTLRDARTDANVSRL